MITMEASQSPLLVDSQSNQEAGLPGLPFNIPYLADFEDGWVSRRPLLFMLSLGVATAYVDSGSLTISC